ncbi:sodium-dependent bicarbonate transport family permease [Leptospira licerasiae]|uniref:sodium-dependent bicarbonate transport family permease n=1 Tax=Leptospira licerasiae TaxID=447106 RepID=UPI001AF025C7|nr:sodium-dependent bicarbonate transport family permease [Leptospira licerasiae]
MEMISSLTASLLTPMVLAFLFGIVITLTRSDLKFPDGLYAGLTIYLLLAIGIKGGVKLSSTHLSEFYKPALAAVLMCCVIPLIAYFILSKIGKFDVANAAAIAAHYGSVSAVTFSESTAFLEVLNIDYEGFMPSLLAIMEIPAILVAIFIAKRKSEQTKSTPSLAVLHELFTGKGTILLIGGLLIGLFSGKKGFEQVSPFFEAPFRGVLALFLLEVGILTGKRFSDLSKVGIFLILFAILMPVVHACAGIYLGKIAGLSLGGATIFGVLCASASYIAAPAAVRVAIPEANATYYFVSSLAITFPFNIIIGLPLYLTISKVLFSLQF